MQYLSTTANIKKGKSILAWVNNIQREYLRSRHGQLQSGARKFEVHFYRKITCRSEKLKGKWDKEKTPAL